MKKKKLHAGGFLKSPFNMYEGSSMDPGRHKQATRQKRSGEESGGGGGGGDVCCLQKDTHTQKEKVPVHTAEGPPTVSLDDGTARQSHHYGGSEGTRRRVSCL